MSGGCVDTIPEIESELFKNLGALWQKCVGSISIKLYLEIIETCLYDYFFC